MSRLIHVLGVSHAGFSAWQACGASQRDRMDAIPTRCITEIRHSTEGVYGAPRIHAEFADEHRLRLPQRVTRLMQAGISGVSRRRFKLATTAGGEVGAAPDLVARPSPPRRPKSRGLPSSSTRSPGRAGSLSQRSSMPAATASPSIRDDLCADLIYDAPGYSAAGRRTSSSSDNSDRGSQYRSLIVAMLLKSSGVLPSSGSRRDACHNNAAWRDS